MAESMFSLANLRETTTTPSACRRGCCHICCSWIGTTRNIGVRVTMELQDDETLLYDMGWGL